LALWKVEEERPLIAEILESFLVEGTTDEARLAVALAYTVEYGTEALIDGWGRDDLGEERKDLAAKIGARIGEGQCPYHPNLRRSIPTYAFVGGYVLYDHDWFLTNLGYVFTEDPAEAAIRFWFGLIYLTEAEGDALIEEITGRGALSDAHLAGFQKHVDAFKAASAFDKRPGGVRWREG